VLDAAGDARSGGQGLYAHGTRFLDLFEVLVDAGPVRRRAHVAAGAFVARFESDLSSPTWSVRLRARFEDVFEVRGWKRAARGALAPPRREGRTVRFSYQGLDGVRRDAVVELDAPFELIQDGDAWKLFARGPAVTLEVRMTADGALAASRPAAWPACPVRTEHAGLAAWLARSWSDLELLMTSTPHGPYPHAGVPWYACPFGRDGILTAFSLLSVAPDVARGVLRYLAATQATADDPARDAQAGKIVHEARAGEMAALGEVPYGRYYGTVDATPLFVMLAGAYFERTGDVDTTRELWPAVRAALAWMDGPGDPDGDGFLEYGRHARGGLVHQGWKDTDGAIFHADGSNADGPIALCEVQAYAHAARAAARAMAAALGRGGEVSGGPPDFAARFDAAFWDEELGTYALALDGAKRPCRLRTSNAGHVLWAGLAGSERVERLAATLLAPDSFSGWGVRTLAEGSALYDPRDYHRGSVWPHDTALVAAGLARYGRMDEARTIGRALLDASTRMPLARLPELFAGLPRDPASPPATLPVACSPQAWAAAVPFLLVDSKIFEV
jgi:glycogen debranching enzyme